MSTPPREPLKCGVRYAANAGTARCTRPFGHDGGHLDQDKDIYWQSEPAAVKS